MDRKKLQNHKLLLLTGIMLVLVLSLAAYFYSQSARFRAEVDALRSGEESGQVETPSHSNH